MHTPKSIVSVFHFRRPSGKMNFGDDVATELIAKITQCETRWAPATQADVVAIGSIIQSFNSSGKSWETRWHRLFKKRQIVWGSGLIQPQKSYIKHADICALRGPLTAKFLGLAKQTLPYGDPGVLFSKYFGAKTQSTEMGVVLHYSHQKKWKNLLKDYDNIKIILAEDEPSRVINSISQCRKIISSSLHGLIAADSFNIPNIYSQFDEPLKGKYFKFYDYALGVEREPHNPKPIRNLKDFENLLNNFDMHASSANPEKINCAANRLEEVLLERLKDRM